MTCRYASANFLLSSGPIFSQNLGMSLPISHTIGSGNPARVYASMLRSIALWPFQSILTLPCSTRMGRPELPHSPMLVIP